MNDRELALAMLDWGELQKKVDELAEKIQAAVLDRGKTQTVGDVRASFSKGRGKYDYENAAHDAVETEQVANEEMSEKMSAHKKVIYDWRKICSELGIDHKPYYNQTSGPSVTVKLLPKK